MAQSVAVSAHVGVDPARKLRLPDVICRSELLLSKVSCSFSGSPNMKVSVAASLPGGGAAAAVASSIVVVAANIRRFQDTNPP